MPNKPKKLILIDGNALIHRAFHALPPLTTKKGELVNAVYGFSSTLLSVVEQFQPDYVAASFDLAGPTFRHEEFADYKAHRQKAPDELYAQIPLVKKVVETFNIPIYEKAGFEADDVIGTLANQAQQQKENIETIIVTGDMDALQLVNEKTKVFTMRRGLSDSVLFDEKAVWEKYSFSPDQLRDFKGLRGDPSDNIPGVKGVGEKTATGLLKEFGTLEKVYENLDQVKGSVHDKLQEDKAQAILSKKLATIDCQVDVKLDLPSAILHEFDRDKITALFRELNFFSLIKRLPEQSRDSENSPQKSDSNQKEVADFKYQIVGENGWQKIFEEIRSNSPIAFCLAQSDQKISGVAFCTKTGRANFIPFSAKSFPLIKQLLEDDRIGKIGFDLKKDYKQLLREKIQLNFNSQDFDLTLLTYLLNPGEKIDLEKLILEHLGEEVDFGEKSKGQLSMLQTQNEGIIARRACQKADYYFKLYKILFEKIQEISRQQKKELGEKNNLENILTKLEMPLIKILADMELAGIKLNPVIFQGISEKLAKQLQDLEDSIYSLAGQNFNINSPSQLSDILFEKLKLPTNLIKKTKTKFSTASGELEKLRDLHPIIEKIEQYRELFKLKNTYLDVIPLLLDEESRIHTSFNQAVTATGRLSSSDPNLQNIPIRTELGRFLRTAFEAQDECVLVGADYSQIDLRAIAHVSEDPKMMETFHQGADIHQLTAAEINQVPLSQVTKNMRRNAKALNFGIIYGIGAYGFSQSAKISRDQAQEFIDTYLKKFAGVANYMQKTREFAKKNGYVETILGRRRYLPQINSSNFQVAAGAERMAINMPIQGLASDIVKLAMIKTERLIEEKYSQQARAILQVHDEIIFEVKKEISQNFAQEIKKVMENVLTLKVPLEVDVKIGDNWGEI